VKSLRVDIYQFMKFVVPTGIDAGGYLGPALHPISLLFFLLHGFVPRGCSSDVALNLCQKEGSVRQASIRHRAGRSSHHPIGLRAWSKL
jgi:hypothetical protein